MTRFCSMISFCVLACCVVLVACGDSGDDSGNGGGSGGSSGDSNSQAGDSANSGGGGFGTGTGTLTIGSESWDITGIGCVFSAAEAMNPDFPFNLSGFGMSETGARAQLSADIYDPSGQERTEGDGVTHTISFNDIEDFTNPSVAWSTVNTADSTTMLTIDGKDVRGEGVFDDETTDDLENEPGMLEVTCP
jgi:hypothetical protein